MKGAGEEEGFQQKSGIFRALHPASSLHGLSITTWFSLQKTSRKTWLWDAQLWHKAAAPPVTPEKAAWIFSFPAGMAPARQGLGTELLPAPSQGCSCPCLLNWFCSVSVGTGPVTGLENTVQGHNPTALRNNTEGKATLLTGGKSK